MIIDISRTLDEWTAVFPGDVPFSRATTMSMDRGDPCNVTAVTASSHAGTHVDLPHHFSHERSVPDLEVFCGPAVVIDASDWSAALKQNIAQGMRVLFKTRNSAAADKTFDTDFACITPAVVEWLARMKAVLVGVDGPSVDPSESKDLPNHNALHRAGIAILENLDLSTADPGQYRLIALPLKIPGADATWVRAVLTT